MKEMKSSQWWLDSMDTGVRQGSPGKERTVLKGVENERNAREGREARKAKDQTPNL